MVGSESLDWVCDDKAFENVMSFIDLPMESFDLGRGDWEQQGSIRFQDSMHSGSAFIPDADRRDIANATLDFLPSLCVPNSNETCNSKPKQVPSFMEETSTIERDCFDGLDSGMFQAPPSPVSCDGSEACCIPVRHSKRLRPLSFKVRPEMSNSVKRKPKKKKKLSQLLGVPPTKINSSAASPLSGCIQSCAGTKKCTHCEVTKTPQWREGPMGPKTLFNACGVRYKSGRLLPEYRPVSSPTFDPSLDSNSHKKVTEMRNMASQEEAAATDSALSPPPQFVPMSNYLFDWI